MSAPDPRPPLAFAVEPEITAGRRAFPQAQEMFFGSPVTGVQQQSLQVGWYDTSVHGEVGSFGCVATGAGLDDLIGEIVRVGYGTRVVFAYVLQDVTLPADTQLALTRRTFIAIARPSLEVVTADVVAVE